MTFLRTLRACLSLFIAVLPAHAQLQFAPEPPLVLHAGAGAGEFTLANSTGAAVPLDLKAGPVRDPASHLVLQQAKVAFSLVPGDATPPATITPKLTVHLLAKVSDLAGIGSATVPVYNGSTWLGELQAIASDAALNVSIDGDGGATSPLLLTEGRPVYLTLKNGDAEAYLVHWVFQIDGVDQDHNQVALAPNGTARILLGTQTSVFSWTDAIHPASRKGALLISVADPSTPTRQNVAAGEQGSAAPLDPGQFPTRILPVNLTMRLLGNDWTLFFSYLYTALALFVGSVISLLGTTLLPNAMRKIALRRTISELADRTSSVSTRIDSYLRVLLRLERKKIDILLEEVGPFSFSSADSFEQIACAIETLSSRLEISERLDELRRRFEDCSETAPPSVTDDIDRKLQTAADALHSFTLVTADIKAANASLDSAADSLAALNDAAAQAKLVAVNLKNLKMRIAAFPPDLYADLKAAMPGLFVILQLPIDDPDKIAPAMLFVIDHAIAAINLVLDYAMVRATIPSAASENCTLAGATARTRLIQRECELLNLLGTLSWRALHEATTLVQQMRENIYEDDVFAEIGKKDQAQVVFDTQKARRYLPVFFSIAFKDSRFNGAAAVQRMVYDWSFPDELFEHGWKVCHFFTGKERTPAMLPPATTPPIHQNDPAPAQAIPQQPQPPAGEAIAAIGNKITIALTVRKQRAQADGTTPQNVLPTTIELQPPFTTKDNARAVELFRFAIAFGVALAGLLSGAVDQLAKLNLIPATIAIAAIGFSADSVKNILTSKTSKKS